MKLQAKIIKLICGELKPSASLANALLDAQFILNTLRQWSLYSNIFTELQDYHCLVDSVVSFNFNTG